VLPRALRNGPLLLVSPHPDDAALSCAALIARDEPIDILTVFTRTPDPPQQGPWDRDTGFASSADSMPMRLREERTAFASTPHRLALLGALEIQYVPDARPPRDAEMLAAALVSWLERHPDGVVAVPAGAGLIPGRIRSRMHRLLGRHGPVRHPDHTFVRDVALDALASHEGAQAVLYEELPYLWGMPADGEVRRVARERGTVSERVVVAVDRVSKAGRIATYETQVPALVDRGRRVDVADDLPDNERYWLLAERPVLRPGAP
jgi:GlcNAc-PI de-N-acetylase